jgi:hypothetical protein
MQTTRKILVGLACGILPITLFMFGTLYSSFHLLNNPNTLKQALDKSGVYTVAVQNGLSKIQPSANNTAVDQIPVNDPQIQAVIEQAIPPQYLEQQTNGVLDTVYAWLHGQSNLSFQVNLSDAKAKLADGLSSYAQQRLVSLPTCTSAANITLDVNPFTATCLPPKFDKVAATQQVHDQIAQNQDFLKNTNITSDTIKNSSGQTLTQRLSRVPSIYKQVQYGLYGSGVLALLCTAGIVFMSSTLRRGIRRAGVVYTTIGAISALLAWLTGLVLDKISTTLTTSSSSTQLQVKSVEAVRLLTNDVRQWWLLYGLILLAVGAVGIVVAIIMRPKGKMPEAKTPETKLPRTVAPDVPISPSTPSTPTAPAASGGSPNVITPHNPR